VVEVAGSNPVAPTKAKGPSEANFRWALFFVSVFVGTISRDKNATNPCS